MAQLVERSLPIPEVRGSNPVISKNLYRTFTVNCIEKTKIKKKRPGIAHFLTIDLTFWETVFEIELHWMQNRTYKIAHVNLPQGLDEISIKPTEWNNQNFIFIQNFKFC